MCLNERLLLDKCVVGVRFLYFLFAHSIHPPEREMNWAARGWNLRPPYYTHTHTVIYILLYSKNLSFISTPSTLRKQRESLKLCVHVPHKFYIHGSKQAMTTRARKCKHTDAQNRTPCVHPQKMCSSLEALAKHCSVKLIVLKTSVHFLLCKKPIPSNPLKHILTLNNLLKPCWSIDVLTC